MAKATSQYTNFIRAELKKPAQKEAKAFAETLARDFNRDVLAVLYYGSCLRTGEVDGLILDFYVLVSDYFAAHGNALSALGNNLVPPNVYYREITAGKKTVRAKVAVLTLEDFEKRVLPKGLNVSVWARFAQPARLLWVKSKVIEDKVLAAVAEAPRTFVSEVLPLLGKDPAPKAIWVEGLRRTYGAELRSESQEKAEELYALNRAYFMKVTPLALKTLEGYPFQSEGHLKTRWVFRKINGKSVSILRLTKAMFTFQGGIDYLAWKIKRSSGVEVTIKPWHRKVPFIAGIVLFIQLRLKGAFR